MSPLRALVPAVLALLVASCVRTDADQFRPLFNDAIAKATRSSQPMVERFLRICLDTMGRASRAGAQARQRGFSPVNNVRGSFLGQSGANNEEFAAIAGRGYRCSIGKLDGAPVARFADEFRTAMLAIGAEEAGPNRYRVRGKPTLGSGKVFFYHAMLTAEKGGAMLAIGTPNLVN